MSNKKKTLNDLKQDNNIFVEEITKRIYAYLGRLDQGGIDQETFDLNTIKDTQRHIVFAIIYQEYQMYSVLLKSKHKGRYISDKHRKDAVKARNLFAQLLLIEYNSINPAEIADPRRQKEGKATNPEIIPTSTNRYEERKSAYTKRTLANYISKISGVDYVGKKLTEEQKTQEIQQKRDTLNQCMHPNNRLKQDHITAWTLQQNQYPDIKARANLEVDDLKKVKKTYGNFIGNPDESKKQTTSIHGFALKRFFTRNDDQETLQLLKTLNRVLEYEQHQEVYKNYFSNAEDLSAEQAKQRLQNFQAYILLVFKKLTREYEKELTLAKQAECGEPAKPRTAREHYQKAEELAATLKEFKKHHNPWARKYDLLERIAPRPCKYVPGGEHKTNSLMDIEPKGKTDKKEGLNSYKIEYNHPDNHYKQERRRSKKMFSVLGYGVSVGIAAGQAALVFMALSTLLSLPFFVVAPMALATFVVNYIIFSPDALALTKFRTAKKVLKAFVFGPDTIGESIGISNMIRTFFSMAFSAAFAVAAGFAMGAALAAIAPLIPAIILGVAVGVVTFCGFNGVINSALRTKFSELKDFLNPHPKAFLNYFSTHYSAIQKSNGKLSKLIMTLAFIGETVVCGVTFPWQIFKASGAGKRWSAEKAEINEINDPRKKRQATIYFNANTFVKFIMWPTVIISTTVVTIATLGFLHGDMLTVLNFIPHLSSTVAEGITFGIIAATAIGEASFNFSTMQATAGRVFGLLGRIAASTYLFTRSPLQTGKEIKKYLVEKSQELVTFGKRLPNDPWKTTGELMESIGDNALNIACAVNAGGNAAVVGGGAGVFQKVGMSEGVAKTTTMVLAGPFSYAAGESFTHNAIKGRAPAKISVKKAKEISEKQVQRTSEGPGFFSSVNYKRQQIQSKFFATHETKNNKKRADGENYQNKSFFQRAEEKFNTRKAKSGYQERISINN